MAIDVLTYNALQEVNQELKAELADLTAQVTAVSGGGGGGSQNQTAIDVVEHSSMLQANQWCRIPTQPAEGGNFTSGVMVCDATGYWRCNCNCTWTVPSGTTCARFQLWGPGGGSSESRCCTFSPIGSTGAYASVIMPVTAGDNYTLCAGCAYCCYSHGDGYNQTQGQASYVQGPGLTNLCAEGGWGSCVYKQIQDRNDQVFSIKCNYCFNSFLGGCICRSGAWVCHEFSTPADGYPEGMFDNSYMPWLSCQIKAYGEVTGGELWKIRGQHSYMAYDYAFPMRYWAATVYGFPNCCQGEGSNGCWVCDNCGGYCQSAWQTSSRRIPGVGGWGTSRCAGNTCSCGDSGRMGAVCVSFN